MKESCGDSIIRRRLVAAVMEVIKNSKRLIYHTAFLLKYSSPQGKMCYLLIYAFSLLPFSHYSSHKSILFSFLLFRNFVLSFLNHIPSFHSLSIIQQLPSLPLPPSFIFCSIPRPISSSRLYKIFALVSKSLPLSSYCLFLFL